MTEELFRNDSYARSCTASVVAVEPGGIVLDRTVFYPTGGGQPGDTGRLVLPDGAAVPIVDTRKGADPGVILHLLPEGAEAPRVGETVTVEIDWDRRYRLMRAHSSLHLLCAAVGGAVTGGQVGEGKGRLDFDLPDHGVDKEAVAARIEAWIAEDHPVRVSWIDADELDRRPELVRTMSVKPPRPAMRPPKTLAPRARQPSRERLIRRLRRPLFSILPISTAPISPVERTWVPPHA